MAGELGPVSGPPLLPGGDVEDVLFTCSHCHLLLP